MLAPLVITKFDDSTWYPDLRLAGGSGSGNYSHAGRPGKVGGSSPLVVFHGTTSAALASIKKDGLVPHKGKGGDTWWRETKGVDFNDPHRDVIKEAMRENPTIIADRNASVYMIQDPKIAGYMAAMAAEVNPGSEPVVLEVDIPRSATKQLHRDEGVAPDPYGAWRYKGTIPPEWIKGRLQYDDMSDTSIDLNSGVEIPTGSFTVKALAAPDNVYRMYFVFLVNDTLKTAGGPGSGNFGHAGRPGHIGGSTVIPSGILSAIQQADGGFTYNALTKDTPTVGYALSIHKEREKILDAKDANVVALAKYTYANRDLLSKSGNYLGGWHNPEDGKVYLDVSTIVKSAAEAERLGREHKQLAYFDLVKGHSVDISEGTHVAKAATESDGAKRWAAFFARSHRARAPADRPRTNSSGDRSSPPDCAAERPLAPTINLKTPTARKAIGVNGRSTAQELTQLQSDRQIDALGGAGSGNYGHAGRPGEVGGSFHRAVHQAQLDIAQIIDSTGVPELNDVVVEDHPVTIRAANTTADVLREMKSKGYRMPDEVYIDRTQESSMSGTTETLGPSDTAAKILHIYLPAQLPKDANPDDAAKIAFGGQASVIVPGGHIQLVDRFVGTTMRDVVIHEMAHVQDSKYRSFEKFPDAKMAAVSVSQYAYRNANEFVAEAFTRQYRGETLTPDALKLYHVLDGPVIR